MVAVSGSRKRTALVVAEILTVVELTGLAAVAAAIVWSNVDDRPTAVATIALIAGVLSLCWRAVLRFARGLED
jgi:hypothetical protein